MAARLCLVVLALAAAAHAEQFEVIQPVENPHAAAAKGGVSLEGEQVCDSGLSSSCGALGVLDVTQVLSAPVLTQPDTLLGIVRKKYMGVEVPIYHFRQSSRLNPKQLPFQIVRVRTIDTTGATIIPVDPVSAADSWFTGYSWDVVVCEQCDGWRHLGWHFRSNATGESFFALIVDYVEGRRGESEGRASILEALTVGVRAPAWVLALAGVATMHGSR
eukprot:CAMPEP_0173391954 /NCGR_PEP_ID=MMETSP1356-20130122/18680_1 /TAXON_ID=77927 ORGANISM="Hemiselmis virescens, Strain PCC157" /NCGR_SAMPLE_ID=MMETSP1356 /ASSEMBLY_ACC=CAM_ASM_000847 /LENGTH=217 /DNA_ID=CAMNT_0014349661 /DNA_START=12 /DNA_END=662 /DNA_ORIENTATION=+